MTNATKKSILIVGASGFVGRFLVKGSLHRNYAIAAGIRNSTSDRHLTDKNLNIIRFEYADKDLLTKQLAQLKKDFGCPQYIVYNAGITKSIDSYDFEKVNFNNLKIFIDALIETDCIPDKFLYISSLSVMGVGDETHYTPYSISHLPHPNSEYGKSKLKAEEYIKSKKNIPHIILRSTGIYGPWEKDYFLMIKTVRSGLNLKVGLRPQLLSFIYIKDLIDAIFLSLESQVVNKTYLLSDGNTYTDDEFANILKELLDKKHTLNLRIPLWFVKIISICAQYIGQVIKKPQTLNRDKYYTLKQRNWTCDISPIKQDLNFSPKYDLKEGLKESIDWYKKNNWL